MYIKNTKILYINLEKDKTRKTKLESQLNKFNFNYHRIDAIYGKDLLKKKYRDIISKELYISEIKLRPSYWLNRSNFKSLSRDLNNILPRVGLFLSHLRALKYAYDNSFNNVVILEDDAIILPNILQKLLVPIDTDIYYLGGTFSNLPNNLKKNPNKYIFIDPDKFKLFGTFGYLIPSFNKIIEILSVIYSVFNVGPSKDKHELWRTGEIKLRAQSIDRFYVNWFQKYGKCYITNIVKVYHPEEDSDESSINLKKFSYKKNNLRFYYHPDDKKLIDKFLINH
uniref:Glycosyl transferase family 25 domain-containing protein n=1 Tax=viral metagenome TaxID=1070528 RepID=A0A6C0J0S2_9ZZZZ